MKEWKDSKGNVVFTESEMTCKCGCGTCEMDEQHMKHLVNLREFLAFPFPVSSACRCETHNEREGGVNSSAHIAGIASLGGSEECEATDIKCFGERFHLIVKHARDFGFTGIGISQSGDWEDRFVHLDSTPGPFRIWSY